MAIDNTVTLSGNLTRDPELKFTNTGLAVTSVGLAVNRSVRNAQGGYDESVGFFELTIFGDIAENARETFRKGTRVIVTGRLDFQTWETDEGDKRSTIKVIVDDIGPSLKWATAQVVRTEKKGDGLTSGYGVTPGATSAAIADFANGLLPPDTQF